MVIVRKILITDDELKNFEENKDKWLSKGLETGGYIFGKLYPNGLAHVTHITDGGPKAERSPVSFSGDNEYASRVKEELQRNDPETRLLAEYHGHPWPGLPSLSGGDINQLCEAKEARPWFVALLSTKDNFKVFDLEIERTGSIWLFGEWVRENGVLRQGYGYTTPEIKTHVKEVPYQIVKTEVASKERLLDRILKITSNDILIEKTVLIVGSGSGGSTLAKYLGCTGIGRIILIDSEELEVANIIRHEGGIDDLGRPKVDICKRIIESHNPFTVVEAYNFDAAKNAEKLEGLASQSDLIIGSSGSTKVDRILNKISVERRIPAIYGGVFEKALGGYVLVVRPFETACYNCLFGITSQSYSVDKEAIQSYGLSEEELHQQQGLWIDISFPALILSKMALAILQGEQSDYNLALYYSSLEIKKLQVARREDCAVCNEEKWIEKVQRPLSMQTSRIHSLREKILSLIRKLGGRDESGNSQTA